MTLILFNKPYGVLSQFTDRAGEGARATLSDYIDRPGVYPAGRLDRDSEGLLLLTDDGRLQSRIADPRFKLAKTYLAQVEGAPAARARGGGAPGVLMSGAASPRLWAGGGPPPALWPRDPPVRFRKSVPDCWLRLTIREGRNRQVRRMTAAVGFPTLRLVRWSVGEWSVEGLGVGEWREGYSAEGHFNQRKVE